MLNDRRGKKRCGYLKLMTYGRCDEGVGDGRSVYCFEHL